MSVWFSLRGMLRQIRVGTLHRVHTVGFLVEGLISFFLYSVNIPYHNRCNLDFGVINFMKYEAP